MLSINEQYVKEAGGFLRALIYRSAEYLSEEVIGLDQVRSLNGREHLLRRIVTHAEPHLDEYLADLLFTASLSSDLRRIPFEEQSIYSTDDDSWSKLTWPTSAVLGIGSALSGGADALLLYDEHAGGHRTAESCAHIVATSRYRSLPVSIQTVLYEVDAIDSFGCAHEQNLSKSIKDMHQARYCFSQDPITNEVVGDFLPAEWKRAIIHACLTAIIFCLENSVDLEDDVEAIKRSVELVYQRYKLRSLHRNHVAFKDVDNRLHSLLGDQAKVFEEALLASKVELLKDTQGRIIPQLLLFSRIVHACRHCWGDEVATMIAVHLLEPEFQAQFSFTGVRADLEAQWRTKSADFDGAYGTYQIRNLPELTIEVDEQRGNIRRVVRRRAPLVIIAISPNPGVIKPNRAATNFLKRRYHGLGLVFIEDGSIGVKTLQKGPAVPHHLWNRLCETLLQKEPDRWYWQQSSDGPAPFILNGSRAHRHVQQSSLTLPGLARLVKSSFF